MLKNYLHQVSIIIVSYNTCELTKNCLKTVLPQINTKDFDAEIIVVDNASSDGSIEMLRREFPQVRLITLDKNLGFGSANNRGIEISHGKYILLLNSDTLVFPGAFKLLLNYMLQFPENVIVAPKLLNEDGTLQKNCWRYPTLWNQLGESIGFLQLLGIPSNYKDNQYNKEFKVNFATGACLLVPHAALLKVGGFDEDFFMYAEEIDLCWRLLKIGVSVKFYPKSVIIHLGGKSSISSENKLRLINISKDLLYKKHYGKAGLIVYKVISIFNCLLRLAFWSLIAFFKEESDLIVTSKVYAVTWNLKWHLSLLH